MTRKYIITADDSIKGFDEEIAKLEREWGAEEIEPSEDAVSRESVLKLAKKGILVSNDNYKCVVNAIKSLPSVTPQGPKGKWIHKMQVMNNPYTYKCSVCKGWEKDKTKYCPNCGAEMSGGGEDEVSN